MFESLTDRQLKTTVLPVERVEIPTLLREVSCRSSVRPAQLVGRRIAIVATAMLVLVGSMILL